MQKLSFVTDEGENIDFFIIDETRVNGVNYLLVCDDEAVEDEAVEEKEQEVDVYILKDISKAEDSEAVYEFVEDEEELNAVGKIFDELMDDVDIK